MIPPQKKTVPDDYYLAVTRRDSQSDKFLFLALFVTRRSFDFLALIASELFAHRRR